MVDEDVKVNASYLLPLSLKRWVEQQARDQTEASNEKVSSADIVRSILEHARREALVAA